MSTTRYRSWEDRLRDRLAERPNRDGVLVPYLGVPAIERVVARRKANKAARRSRRINLR